MPNRDYWLAPERRERTAQKTASFILWMGALTLFALRVLFHHIYRVNTLGPPQELQYFWLGFTIYLAAAGVLIWKFYRSFRL